MVVAFLIRHGLSRGYKGNHLGWYGPTRYSGRLSRRRRDERAGMFEGDEPNG
jgi:hypothetical protein